MKLFHSIKWRLLVWQTILLTGVLLVLLTLHYQIHRRNLIAAVDAELQETLLIVMPVVAPRQNSAPPDRPTPDRPTPDRPAPDRRMRPLPLSGQPGPGRRQTTATPVENIATEVLKNLKQQNLYLLAKNGEHIQTYGDVPVALKDHIPFRPQKPQSRTLDGNRELIQPNQVATIILGRPLDELNAEMASLLGILILVGATVMAVGFAIGWLIVSRSLRPIGTISDTAKTIASGSHHKRIELSDAPEELASMAHTLNDTFDHLDEMIENHKRFSADASHELRTPISVVIAQAETTLKRERTADEYQTALQACLRAGRRMKNMAESLLTLTRIDSHSTALALTACDLNDILSEVVDTASLLSEKHPVDFSGTETPFIAQIDRDRIHQAVMNLLHNAIQHNPDGCPLHVSLKEKNRRAVIEVRDEGIGIPAEHLPHLFERFYRVDKSRSRAQGGAGLGLAIVQSLIEAHTGTIQVSSEAGQGTTFTIALPLS